MNSTIQKFFRLLCLIGLVFCQMSMAAKISHTQLKFLDAETEFKNANLNQLEWSTDSVRLKPGALHGSLETPAIPAPTFNTAVVSWNANTPPGTQLSLEIRARIAGRWTQYYPYLLWGDKKHSYNNKSDADGHVNTDTLQLKKLADALQVRVSFDSKNANTSPNLFLLAALTSDSHQHLIANTTASTQAVWGTELNVPQHSQMIYPNGGEVWCSPTSVTMLLGYWSAKLGTQFADTVPNATQAVWDEVYDGAGNWPFNTAYAASKNKNLQAYVSRLNSLVEAENYISRGVPLAMSIAWKKGELVGAHVQQVNGHLVVLRGFTKTGDPIINDPAAKTDAGVRTIYKREEFERAWVGHSGGIVYVIEQK